MSFQLKVNIKKGWPSPSILEKTAAADVAIAAGKIGLLDNTTGNWVLPANSTTVDAEYHVFMNDSTDPDAARGESDLTGIVFKQIPWGGVHGISLANPLEIETVQYTGTPAKGDKLTVDTAGKVKTTVTTGNVIVGIVTEAPHTIGSSTYITFVAEPGKRLVP